MENNIEGTKKKSTTKSSLHSHVHAKLFAVAIVWGQSKHLSTDE